MSNHEKRIIYAEILHMVKEAQKESDFHTIKWYRNRASGLLFALCITNSILPDSYFAIKNYITNKFNMIPYLEIKKHNELSGRQPHQSK